MPGLVLVSGECLGRAAAAEMCMGRPQEGSRNTEKHSQNTVKSTDGGAGEQGETYGIGKSWLCIGGWPSMLGS